MVIRRSLGQAKKKTKAQKEKVLGIVDHWFGQVSVAAFKLKNPIKVGDLIRIKGHTTDFVQSVESMQINHQDIQKAAKGKEIGIKVAQKVRAGDKVYLALKPKEIKVQSGSRPQMPKPAGETRFLNF